MGSRQHRVPTGEHQGRRLVSRWTTRRFVTAHSPLARKGDPAGQPSALESRWIDWTQRSRHYPPCSVTHRLVHVCIHFRTWPPANITRRNDICHRQRKVRGQIVEESVKLGGGGTRATHIPTGTSHCNANDRCRRFISSAEVSNAQINRGIVSASH